MINQFKSYSTTQAYTDFERLPKGGYILKVLGVSTGYGERGNQYVKISCDIAEGEYANYYTMAYKANPNEDKKWVCNYLLSVPTDNDEEWMRRRFKTTIEAFEDSNEGYHFDWNETRLKGLLIGGLFNEREYEGSDGQVRRATNLAKLIPVEKIREGKYKIPDDKLLSTNTSAPAAVNEGFMQIPSGADNDGLPFA